MKIRKVKGLFKVSMGSSKWAWFKSYGEARVYCLEAFGLSVHSYTT